MTDEATLDVYNAKVSEYQALPPSDEEGVALTQFMSVVKPNGYKMPTLMHALVRLTNCAP